MGFFGWRSSIHSKSYPGMGLAVEFTEWFRLNIDFSLLEFEL
jgi:hypothetical protein